MSTVIICYFLICFVLHLDPSHDHDLNFIRYVRDLMGHTTTHLVEMASRKDLASIAQQPDVMMMVSFF